MSKVMSKINNAVMNGGKELEGFAKVSGMTGQEFARLWNSDPYAAIQKFEQGIKETNDSGQNYKKTLENLGITELRETDTVLRLANGNKQLADARTHANKGWKEGTALSTEAEQKYKSLGNQMKIFMNHVRALGIEIGSALAPILKAMMKVLTPMIDALAKAPAPIKLMVVALGLIPIVAVPVLASLAAITGAMGLMGQAMNTATFAAGRNSKALRIYSASMGLLTSPISSVKKGLSSMPGLFWKTGGAAKGSSGGIKAAGTGMLSLLNPMKLVRGILPALSLGFKGLLTVFRIITGPIGLTITVIMSLYKAFKSAYDNVEWFRKGIDGLVYTFKVFGGGIIGTVVSKIKDLGNWFSKTGSQIKNGFTKNLKEGYNALGDDDLLKKGVNGFKGAMQVLGTASKKASDSTKVLGKGVSKETKGALGNYVKYSNSSNKILEQVKLNHGDISKKKATELLSIEDKLTNDLVSKLEKRKQDELKNAQEVFENSKALSQKEKDAIIAGIEDRNNKAINKEKELSAKIKQVKEAAMADGNISEKEMAQIEKLENQRRELTVKNLTKTEKEQDKILSRMKNNREALSVSEASSAIKQAEKARKARVKEIKDEYDDKVYAIDQMVGLSKEQKQKLLDEAEDEKNKQIDKANKKKEGVVKSVKDQNKNIETEMDTSNGEVYSNAEKWWNKTKEFFADDSLWQAFKKGMKGIGGWFSEQGATFSKNFKKGWTIASKAGGDLWGWIKQTGSGIGGWFAQKGRDFWSALKNGWNNAITASGDIWSSIKQTGANIGGWFSQKGSQLWGSMKTGWNNAITTTGDLWNTLTTWLGSKWEITKQWFVIKGSNMWSSIKQGWNNLINMNPGALWTTLTSALGTAWEITKQWFITKGQQMGSALSQGWNTVKGFVVNTFNSIWVNVKMIWQGIWGTITYWTGLIWGRIKLVWTWIKNNTVNAFTTVWNAIKRIWSGIKNTIVYWTTLIWNRVKFVWGWIKSNTVGAFTTVWNTIKRIWAGIKGTIVYWTTAIWNRVKAVWSWIKSNTLGAFNYVWNTIKRIWKNIKNTISYWTGAIWNRIKGVWGWVKSNTANAFTWVWNKIKSIWSGIKGTITYWTGAIWNRVKGVWNWIKSNTASAFNWVWNKIKSIWRSIKGTITYWTGAIWGRIKSIWSSIKTHTYNIFNSIWNKLKSIWNSIFGTIKYWMNKIWSKVRIGWNTIKKHTVDMVTGAKNAVVNKFTDMYNGAKKWIDKIGSYIDGAKKWMKDKAVSLGKSVANGAISGLNKMIGGINKISKAITSKKLMDKIPELSTGTGRGKPKSNSKGQLKQPTTAVVNDRGRGNGQGRNGHQEIIQKSNGQMYAPRGKNVVVGLEKGDIVHNGQDTQAMQSQGIIPHFRKGTKKKKKNAVLDALGGASKGVGDKISDGYHSTKKASKDAMDTVKEGGAKVLEKGKDAASWLGDKIGDVWDYVKDPGKLVKKMMGGIGFGKENKTMEMAGLAFSKLKKSLVDKVKSWFEEAEGGEGDAGWLFKHDIWQKFGPYTGGLGFNGGQHFGVDFGMTPGTNVKAVAGGKVSRVWNDYGGGKSMEIDLGGGLTNWYMHLSKQLKKKGDKVGVGDLIAKSGNTGNFTAGSGHLHFQLNKNGKPQANVLEWLKGLGSSKGGGKYGSTIKKALGMAGLPQTSKYIKAWQEQARTESTFNPKAYNPSGASGLVQVKPATFNQYKLPGHGNIWNPLDNLIAGMRYAKARYGKGGMLSRIGVGGPYANGGLVTKHQVAEIGEGNKPEMVIPLTRKARAMQLIDQAKSFMGVDDEGSISSVQNTSTDSAMVQVMEQNNKLLEMLIGVVQNKELIVDKQAIVDTANNGLGKRYKEQSYTRGGI